MPNRLGMTKKIPKKINPLFMKRSIEWAAGLFEGEGCIYSGKNSRQLILQMSDKDVVESFCDIVGVGSVKEQDIAKRTGNPNHKKGYRWIVCNKKDIISVLDKLLPYLGNQRAYKALNILDDLEL